MNPTTISTFTQAAQQAQQWVNELAGALHWSEQHAYRLLKAVLHTLRDWLSQEEMADLSAQLPVLIRGIYFEGWKPSDTPVWERKKRDFVISVRAGFGAEARLIWTPRSMRCSSSSTAIYRTARSSRSGTR